MGCLFQTTGGGGSPYWGDGVANFASLPAAGDVVGQIRQALDTGFLYKWDGATWDLFYNGATGTGDVVGPASSTTDAIATYADGTGKLIQDTVVTIDVAGIMSGVTQFNIDNLRLDGNTVSSTNANGDINLSPNGAGTVVINTDLDVDNVNINGNTISSTNANGNVAIDPNGTGFVALESQVRLPEIATPTTPASGYGMLYFKSDGIAYSLNDAGTETALGGGGGDVVGPASATDEAIARFNLTTGKLIQDSAVTITDAGIMAGITQLNVDNLRLDGNTLSATDANGSVILSASGTGVVQILANKGLLLSDDDSSVGVTLKVPATLSGNWTLTLPDNDGNSGQYLQTNGSGTTSWQTVIPTKGLVSAKSADYTITDIDDIYQVNMTTGGTNRTVTLPTAADNTNRVIVVKKVDTGTGTLTLDGEGAETIDGVATQLLVMPQESITVICDGTGWFVDDRYYGVKVSETWTDTETNATTTAFITRVKDRWFVDIYTPVTGAFSGSDYNITIPSKYAADTTNVYQNVNTARPYIGQAQLSDSGAPYPGTCSLTSSTNIRVFGNNSGSLANITSANPFTWANGDYITAQLNWYGTGI